LWVKCKHLCKRLAKGSFIFESVAIHGECTSQLCFYVRSHVRELPLVLVPELISKKFAISPKLRFDASNQPHALKLPGKPKTAFKFWGLRFFHFDPVCTYCIHIRCIISIYVCIYTQLIFTISISLHHLPMCTYICIDMHT
jgi:hypothetical protein